MGITTYKYQPGFLPSSTACSQYLSGVAAPPQPATGALDIARGKKTAPPAKSDPSHSSHGE